MKRRLNVEVADPGGPMVTSRRSLEVRGRMIDTQGGGSDTGPCTFPPRPINRQGGTGLQG